MRINKNNPKVNDIYSRMDWVYSEMNDESGMKLKN